MRSVTKRLGRPPAYDRAAAVGAMTNVFWQQGFAATSLDDIALATRMNRPSLYAAFGDKRAMYLLALEAFAARAVAGMAAELAKPELAEALAGLFDQAIAVYTDGLVARGCFLVCSGAHEAADDPDARAAVAGMFAAIEAQVRDRFSMARAEELPVGLAADDAARIITAIAHSMAVRARTGAPEAELRALAGLAIRMTVVAPGA
jgi:TetR/AcrR family transcriptional regulator, copper-responsive repressor